MEMLKIKGQKNFNKEVFAPPSKSFSHRYIIGAFLSGKKAKVSNIIYSKDTIATLGAIEKMGALVKRYDNSVEIEFDKINDNIEIDCIESASTLRFIIPIVAALGIKAKIYGRKSLMMRPLDAYTDLFDREKIGYEYKKGEYIKIFGKMNLDKYEIDGNVSSQYITGMLFALSVSEGKKVLKIRKTLTSRPYVDITLDVLRFYGINVKNNDYKSFEIEGRYTAKDSYVEGDYSNGCAFIGAALLGGKIKINNLLRNSVQGDKKFIDFMQSLGGKIKICKNYIECEKSNLVSGKTFDISNCPDIAPVLSAVCAFAEDKTVITGIQRLRVKESDRAAAIVKTLTDLGISTQCDDEKIVITGAKKAAGNTVDTFNDHRIAMMAAVMSVMCDEKITLLTPMCVEKSYPAFYHDFDGIIKTEKC